jgi:hypothetical protein
VEVWPDNLLAVSVFIAMGTQWRIGMGGVTGLDYNALPVVMRSLGVPRNSKATVFDEIQILEDSALSKMHEKE